VGVDVNATIQNVEINYRTESNKKHNTAVVSFL